MLWHGWVDVVGELGAKSYIAAAAAATADGERAEPAVMFMSLLWNSSGETDVGVSVEKGG